jgi:membrane-bound lytic murein transglycosylase D
MTLKIYRIILLSFITQISLAQNHKPTQLTHSKLDKVIVNEIAIDTLVWYFEDFKETMIIDNRWQELWSNETLFAHQQDLYKTQKYFEEVDKVLSTEILKERLSKLNTKTPLDIGYHPELEQIINYYLKSEKANTERLMSLSQYYFPMFESIFDKHDIPLEIKYLAIVESALNPRAKSWVGATGLWQFMYGTGKMYDLNVSSYVDERMDPIRSTEAAAKYLRHLYEIFDDWNLALAAYNSGPGNVNKAIRRSGGKRNYWAIRPYLPRETAGYIPSFFAVMYLYEYAEEHQYQPALPQVPYLATDTIHAKNLIKLEQVAKITNSDFEFIKFLNPSYKLDIIPYEPEKSYTLRLPYRAAGLYVANEDKVYDFAKQEIEASNKKLPTYYKTSDKIRYRVRRGDILGKIAERYGVGVSQIKRWNGLRSSRINIGDRLTIYPRKADQAHSPSKETKEEAPKAEVTHSTAPKLYTVKSGDSLWSISKKFKGVTVKDLKSLNNLKNSALKPGMQLKISS